MSHALAGVAGFEPTNGGIKTRCLTAWLYPKKFGEPVGIRTQDTRLRRPLLYPAELRTHAVSPRDTDAVSKKMERMMRIELTLPAWKAGVLPLNYIRPWSGRRDSNSRPSPWQGDALPLSHFRIYWSREMDSNHRKLS